MIELIAAGFLFAQSIPQLSKQVSCVIVPSAYTLGRGNLLGESPLNFRYGARPIMDVLVGASVYPGPCSWLNFYAGAGAKLMLLDETEGAPMTLSGEVETKCWLTVKSRWGVRAALVAGKELNPFNRATLFVNYGASNFGQSLGPLDYYLDKMRMRIVPLLGLSMRTNLGDVFWVDGEITGTTETFYDLDDDVWRRETMLAYSIGCGFGFSAGHHSVVLLRTGLCVAPRQAASQYYLLTRMIENGEARSCRDAGWWGFYRLHIGIAFHQIIK